MKKADIYGIAGSLLSCILLFLLLWFVVIPMTEPVQDDEGIMVSFGETLDGGGNVPQAIPEAKPEVAAATPSKPVTKPVKEEVLTQKDNSAYIAEQNRKKEEKALKEAQAEKDRIAAEKKRKEQEAINNANNAMSGAFGNSNTTGTGNTSGNTKQGNPLGSGTSGGNSWSLSGRSLSGRLVNPSYDNDVEGKITVNIRVDENGSVVSATIGSPTNISDAATRNAALAAAKSTRFTAGSSIATGSITYNFNLR